MKVLVLGASGIIGQHMRLCVPPYVTPIWYRRTPDPITYGADLTDEAVRTQVLEHNQPDVIINLAGESRPDVVEGSPKDSDWLNVELPIVLAKWAELRQRRYIHVSSQAVFEGGTPPYDPDRRLVPLPVNAYGMQKAQAEATVRQIPGPTIVRPTFVLGVRPLPQVGRANPAEQMLAGQEKQVSDRWFSPLFARDAARLLWSIVTHDDGQRVIHLGIPRRTSRYDVAQALGVPAEPVSHDSFPGIASRPVDTTYAAGTTRYLTDWNEGLAQIRRDWQSRHDMDVRDRAREIALFLGLTEDAAYDRLSKGFGYQHAAVTMDFRAVDPGTDEEDLLAWYRTTLQYIWELSAYHADPGWNYMGMCGGIAERLRAAGAKRVLCLGDGVGDLTLSLYRAGFDAVYHDLAGSRTAEFANFRFWRHTGRDMMGHLTGDWQPMNGHRLPYDAVVSLDFLEHVPNVEAWTTAIRDALVPGGLFAAQNAFAIGSGPDGSLPMHLACNDRWEKDWDPHLAALGFRQLSPQWYQRAA